MSEGAGVEFDCEPDGPEYALLAAYWHVWLAYMTLSKAVMGLLQVSDLGEAHESVLREAFRQAFEHDERGEAAHLAFRRRKGKPILVHPPDNPEEEEELREYMQHEFGNVVWDPAAIYSNGIDDAINRLIRETGARPPDQETD